MEIVNPKWLIKALCITIAIQSCNLKQANAAVVKIVPNQAFCDSFANKAFKEFLFSKYSKALRDFDTALLYCPGGKDTLAQIYTYRAATEIGLDKYKNALNDCDLALKLDNKRGDSYMFKGAAEAYLGNFTDVLNDEDKALLLNDISLDSISHFSLMNVLPYAPYDGPKIQPLNMYETLDGEKHNMYDLIYGFTYNMCSTLHGLISIDSFYIKFAEAGLKLKAYGEPHGQDSSLADFYCKIGFYYSGDIYTQFNDFDSSDKYYTKAIAIDSLNGDNYMVRGHNYFTNCSFAPAIKDFTKAIDIYGKKHNNWLDNVYDGRAMSEAGLKQYQNAINDESRVIAIDGGKNTDAYYKQGICYWLLNKKDKAKLDFEKVVAGEGDDALTAFSYLYLGDTLKADSIIPLQLDRLIERLSDIIEKADFVPDAFNDLSSLYYDASCFAALRDDPNLCVFYLELAMAGGLNKKKVLYDPDFDSIRNTPEFIELMKDY